MSNTLTFRDLCHCILHEARVRDPNRSPAHVWPWYQQKFKLMCQEFDVVWPEDGYPPREAPYIVETMIDRYSRLTTPFAGIMCYTFKGDEEQKFKHHMAVIKDTTKDLQARWLDMMCDMMAICWPEAVAKTTTWDRLRELGLGDAPSYLW
jgi:hypothetical protein